MQLAFVADKGGVGKSLLASHVAARLALSGRRTVLVDLDRRHTSGSSFVHSDVPVQILRLGEIADIEPDADTWYVWDTPAHPSPEMRAALMSTCDLVLIVTDYDFHGELAAIELARDLASQGSARLGVVLNGVPPTSSCDALVADLAAAGAPVLDAVVRRYAAFVHARFDGRLVCDYAYAKADAAWADIADLTDAILEEIHAAHVV